MQVIRVNNVSKRYLLHSKTLSGYFPSSFHKAKKPGFPSNEFWALKNISFSVEEGESVSIIGLNGAGKSTILKILSRVTTPTGGEVHVHGRVSPLIELGAGMNPELTGRENIFLNGAILGMSREEIKKKLDQMIAFSELKEFIDVPVKYYSSGMYVRLGFAIAIHTNPDILLVDEVLAVGDSAYRLKCTEKIMELKEKGVTIIFISHNLQAVRGVSSRAIFLHEGQIVIDGKVDDALDAYQKLVNETTMANLMDRADRSKFFDNNLHDWNDMPKVRIGKVAFLDGSRAEQETFKFGQKIIIRVEYVAQQKISNPVLGLGIIRSDGIPCCAFRSIFDHYVIPKIEGEGYFELEIERIQLNSGVYSVRAWVINSTLTAAIAKREAGYFKVEAPIPSFGNVEPVFFPDAKWHHSPS